MRRLFLLTALLLGGVGAQASAQAHPVLTVVLDTSHTQPRVHLVNLFADPQWRDIVEHGVPIRISWSIEQRKSGFLGSSRMTAHNEFNVFIKWNPTLRRFESTLTAPGVLTSNFSENIDSLNSRLFGAPSQITLKSPRESGTGDYFYNVDVVISAIDPEEYAAVMAFQGEDSKSWMAAINNLITSKFLPKKLLNAQTVTFSVKR